MRNLLQSVRDDFHSSALVRQSSGLARFLWSSLLLLAAILGSTQFVPGAPKPEPALPIPPPPQDRSLLPAPREGVVMVRTVKGRLNVTLGGWGGQRLNQAKTDPEKARSETDWQLANTGNKNSAASAVQNLGCGFFMTEGGIEGKAETEPDQAARLAGVQRVVEVCEERGFGWCLWAHGDWSDGFGTYGAKLKTHATYPLITGQAR
jgi:hypothetical protein